MRLRLALGGAAALFIILLLMPGGLLVKGIAAAAVLALLAVQASPGRREKAIARRGETLRPDPHARPI